MKESFIYSLQRPGMSFMLRQTVFEEENAEHLHISLILHFSTSPILQLSFFVF